MHYHIESIILWSHHHECSAKVISLSANRANVIIGEGKTGKSSLLGIVDYCLGAKKLNVPIGEISTFVRVFGLSLVSGKKRILIARDTSKKRYQAVLLENSEPKIPNLNQVTNYKSISIDQLKSYLADLLDAPCMHVELSGLGRASFRDFLALNFQAQFILANPSIIFHPKGKQISIQKLRCLLPDILNPISPSAKTNLAIKKLIDQLERISISGKALVHEKDHIFSRILELYRSIYQHFPNELPPARETWPNSRYIEELEAFSGACQPLFDLLKGTLDEDDNADPVLDEGRQLMMNSISKSAAFSMGRLYELLQSSQLLDRIEDLRNRYREIKQELDQLYALKKKKPHSRAENNLSQLLSIYAQQIGLERSGWTPCLDFSDLKLKFKRSGKEAIELERLGSAQTFIGYHVAVYLALHELFISTGSSGIFPFVFLDQPSQAFGVSHKEMEGKSSDTDDETRLRNLFSALEFASKRTNRKLQIILLETPNAAKFLNSANINVVANWSAVHERALVPQEWIDFKPLSYEA